jgi:energy-coupling factor transport system substrate-specific component
MSSDRRAGPGEGPASTRWDVVRLRPSSWLVLLVASVLGLVAFAWPLFANPTGSEDLAHSADAPWVFVALLPLLFAVILTQLNEGELDAKAVALLGVLAACGAVLRLPSGIGGFEPMFFLLIPAGRVLGRGFGFVLGGLTMFASALLTGGVGPWLPFQMFGAAWLGFGAGCLPPLRGRAEIWMLAGYAFVSALAYGMLLNLWFWPYSVGSGTEISFVAGDPLGENLRRFWAFHLTTSLGWDLPRAVTNAGLVLLVGRPVVAALRRAARRAAFGVAVEFGASAAPETQSHTAGLSSRRS